MIPFPPTRSLRRAGLFLAAGMMCVSSAGAFEILTKGPDGEDMPPPLKGKYVTTNFRQSDYDALKDKQAFLDFYDNVYMNMAELTNNHPPMFIRGQKKLGAWGVASLDGIKIEWSAIADFMHGFDAGHIVYGSVHEIGHVFDARDFPRWYITPHAGGEMFANFKLSYVFDRQLTKDNHYRINFGPGGDQIGYDFNNKFYPPHGEKYLASDTTWDKMSVDALHAFHLQFVRKYGWDIYKKWFRAYQVIEEGGVENRAPGTPDEPVRMQLVCALLSGISGEDLLPVFKKWRMPVTGEDVAKVTERYKLPEVLEKVNKGFLAEYLKGDIHLDPLSLEVRPMTAPSGKTGFTLWNIFGTSPDVQVRYTLDGSEPGAKAKIYAGTPVAAASGTTVKAALFVKGKTGPVLSTSSTL